MCGLNLDRITKTIDDLFDSLTLFKYLYCLNFEEILTAFNST